MSDDTFTGTNGNDKFNGGAGSDTVTFAGIAAGYRIDTLADGRIRIVDINLSNGDTGSDILTGIETLQFADKDYSLGSSGSLQGEIQVNTYTGENQNYPLITTLADGGYVITWMSMGQDGSDWGIYAQRFAANGNTVGSETLINTTTVVNQDDPAITALSDGGYVITWHSNAPNAAIWGIYAQRYDLNGIAVGEETLISTNTETSQNEPAIAALANGHYVIAWQSYGHEGDGYGIYAQRFGADGNKVGEEARICSSSQVNTAPTITTLTDGGYVIAWTASTSSDLDIYVQRFDAGNNKVGDEARVNSYAANTQETPDITALADGGYVVTWTSQDQDVTGHDIYAQRYDVNGNVVGGETRVNTSTSGHHYLSAITALADGGFVIVWASDKGSNDDVYMQRFAVNGAKVGDETLVNTDVGDRQYFPDIAACADGGFIITWASDSQDASGYNIHAQRFDAEGQPWLAALEITGTASADTLNAGLGKQSLLGLGGDDKLSGGGGVDTLLGGEGIDLLIGGSGKDKLIGNDGADLFRFQDAMGSGVDTIRDFGTEDVIQLENSVFNKLAATGALKTANFVANASGTAADGNDYIVYNTTTGELSYDSNGSAAGWSYKFATLTGIPALTATDFEVI